MNYIRIKGGGISGLCAAINLVKSGYAVDVYEKRDDCGKRFHGDLEGFENWSSKDDVFEELKSCNIKINFDCFPSNFVYMTNGKDVLKNTFDKPMFYLVKRGAVEKSLDIGLKNQAIENGVNIHFNKNVSDDEVDIISTGVSGKKCIAVAKGVTFNTESDNIAVAIISQNTSNKGYSYLLINNGLGTICTVNFSTEGLDLNLYLKNTKNLVKKLFDVDIRNEKKAGGIGCFHLKPRLIENKKIFTGEAAGLQDFLWGFGMRYAVNSGYLAAKSIIENIDYAELIKEKLLGRINTSIVNRYIIELIGDRFNRYLIWRAKRNKKWMNLLYSGYNPTILSNFILPIARWNLQQKYRNL
jgi:flavin-dependent dehydrogenase